MTRTLVARLLAATGLVVLLAGCGSGADVDTSQIPLVTPPPITAVDGTSIPVPPQVADNGTPSQRDRYAAQSLVPTKLSTRVPAAAAACKILDGGTTPEGVVRSVAAREKIPEVDAARVVYAGTLSWCPKYRATFDDLAAQTHGGPKNPHPGELTSLAASIRSSSKSTTSSPTTSRSSSKTSSRSSSSSDNSSDSSSDSN